ncbi:MAG: flagellin [Gammaproteobacteria bacterium]|nr:flagellin [Gammaproteobacteria bacterium]MDH3448357.1 flagellin [Gammaproteobacteria bacterium]
MPQIINTNIASLTAQRNLNGSQSSLATSLQRLSTGLRINSAKDDAAGLAISERFSTQIRGLNQAIRNANDGVSFAQTAEGALSTTGDALQRIRELAVQSINDTNSSSDRQALNNEVSQLIAEVNRIANSTQFNGQNILNGTLSTLTFQVGANQGQTIQVTGVDSRTAQLGARISTSGSISGTNLAAAIAADDLVINGNAVSLTGDVTIEDVIGSINAVSADSGIQALKATSVSTAAAGLSAAADGTVSINGVTVSLTNTATVGSGALNIAAINAVSNQTGVTASAGTGEAVVLSNSDGADIVIADGTTTLGGGPETYSAGIILAGAVADGAFTATGTFTVEVGSNALGATQADNTLAGVNVLTGSNANDALLTLDFALQQVSGLRAELGAVQTRFESTISNLSVTSENLSAARSRIRDADFAAETAELTRSQILQQAGIAILAQANAQPQNVLALLQ